MQYPRPFYTEISGLHNRCLYYCLSGALQLPGASITALIHSGVHQMPDALFREHSHGKTKAQYFGDPLTRQMTMGGTLELRALTYALKGEVAVHVFTRDMNALLGDTLLTDYCHPDKDVHAASVHVCLHYCTYSGSDGRPNHWSLIEVQLNARRRLRGWWHEREFFDTYAGDWWLNIPTWLQTEVHPRRAQQGVPRTFNPVGWPNCLGISAQNHGGVRAAAPASVQQLALQAGAHVSGLAAARVLANASAAAAQKGVRRRPAAVDHGTVSIVAAEAEAARPASRGGRAAVLARKRTRNALRSSQRNLRNKTLLAAAIGQSRAANPPQSTSTTAAPLRHDAAQSLLRASAAVQHALHSMQTGVNAITASQEQVVHEIAAWVTAQPLPAGEPVLRTSQNGVATAAHEIAVARELVGNRRNQRTPEQRIQRALSLKEAHRIGERKRRAAITAEDLALGYTGKKPRGGQGTRASASASAPKDDALSKLGLLSREEFEAAVSSSDYPDPVPPDTVQRVADTCRAALLAPQRVCSVCDCIYTPDHPDEQPVPFDVMDAQYRPTLTHTLVHPPLPQGIIDYYDLSLAHGPRCKILSGLLLSPHPLAIRAASGDVLMVDGTPPCAQPSVTVADEATSADGEVVDPHLGALWVCSPCLKALKAGAGSHHRPPVNAIANHNAIGVLPGGLTQLTYPEVAMCSLVHQRGQITVLQGGGQKSLKGHVLTVAMNPQKVRKMLPLAPSDLPLRVVIASKLTQTQRLACAKSHVIDKGRVMRFLDFLMRENCYYGVYGARVEKDATVLSALADEFEGNSLIELQQCDLSDEAPRVGALPPMQAGRGDSGSGQGLVEMPPLPESVLQSASDERNSEENERNVTLRHIAVIKDPATDEHHDAFAAMYEFDPTRAAAGSVLAVKTGKLMHSHQVTAAMAFPDCFPYGRGGDTEERRVKMSTDAWLRRLQRLSRAGRFHSASFVTKAYDAFALDKACKDAYVKVKLRDLSFRGLNAAEMLQLLDHQRSCAHALRTHQPMPQPPGTLSPTAQLLFRSMRSVVGAMPHTDEYAKQEGRLPVFAMWNMYGPPTLMLTLNPNDLASFELMFYASGGDPKWTERDAVPSGGERSGALADCPGAAAMAFKRAVHIFVRHAIGYDLEHHSAVKGGGLFGVAVAVFGAVEEQGRGSCHLHIEVWIEGARPPGVHPPTVTMEELRRKMSLYGASVLTAQTQLPEKYVQCAHADKHVAADRRAQIPVVQLPVRDPESDSVPVEPAAAASQAVLVERTRARSRGSAPDELSESVSQLDQDSVVDMTRTSMRTAVAAEDIAVPRSETNANTAELDSQSRSRTRVVPHVGQIKNIAKYEGQLKVAGGTSEPRLATCQWGSRVLPPFAPQSVLRTSIDNARAQCELEAIDLTSKEAFNKLSYASGPQVFVAAVPPADASPDVKRAYDQSQVELATTQLMVMSHDPAHRATCMKKGGSKCRFHFPHRPMEVEPDQLIQFHFPDVGQDDSDPSTSSSDPQNPSSLPTISTCVPRDGLSVYHNQCNPAVTALFRCNNDVKLIVSPGSAFYITAYTTKSQDAEVEHLSSVWQALERGGRRDVGAARQRDASVLPTDPNRVSVSQPLRLAEPVQPAPSMVNHASDAVRLQDLQLQNSNTTNLQLVLRSVRADTSDTCVGAMKAAYLISGGQRFIHGEKFVYLVLGHAERLIHGGDATFLLRPAAAPGPVDAEGDAHLHLEGVGMNELPCDSEELANCNEPAIEVAAPPSQSIEPGVAAATRAATAAAAASTRSSRSKPAAVVYTTSSLQDYIYRPAELEEVSWYHFSMGWSRVSRPKAKSRSGASEAKENELCFTEEHPLFHTHRLSHHRVSRVPVVAGNRLTDRNRVFVDAQTQELDPDAAQEWGMKALLLFHPFRAAHLVDDGHQWGTDAYALWTSYEASIEGAAALDSPERYGFRLRTVMQNMQYYHLAQEERVRTAAAARADAKSSSQANRAAAQQSSDTAQARREFQVEDIDAEELQGDADGLVDPRYADPVLDDLDEQDDVDETNEVAIALQNSGVFDGMAPPLDPRRVFEPPVEDNVAIARLKEQFKVCLEAGRPVAVVSNLLNPYAERTVMPYQPTPDDASCNSVQVDYVAHVDAAQAIETDLRVPSDVETMAHVEALAGKNSAAVDAAKAIYRRIAHMFTLNEKQSRVLALVARRFFWELLGRDIGEPNLGEVDAALDVSQAGDVHVPNRGRNQARLSQRTDVSGPSQPLIMYMAGAAGTGKSVVVNSIRSLFQTCSQSRSLLVTATTGVAAVSLGGMTLHGALGVGGQRASVDDDEGRNSRISEELQNRMSPINWIIVDEIGMCGAQLMKQMSARLQTLKGSYAASFGGINVIFAGDFSQLPPVLAKSLSDPTPSPGRRIWTSISAVVVLTQSMRQASDPAYAAILSRLSEGKLEVSDIRQLNQSTRPRAGFAGVAAPHIDAANGVGNRYESTVVPVIVAENEQRHAVNRLMFDGLLSAYKRSLPMEHAAPEGAPREFPFFQIQGLYVAAGTRASSGNKARRVVEVRIRPRCASELRFIQVRSLDHVLQLHIGMELLVTENLQVRLKIANGSRAVLVRLQLSHASVNAARAKTSSGVRVYDVNAITCLVVRLLLPDRSSFSTLTYERHLGPGEFCIYPSQGEIDHKSSQYQELRARFGLPTALRLRQFPVVPATCLTAHKLQGATVRELIVGTYRSRAPRWLYVVLSRLKERVGLRLIHPLPLDPRDSAYVSATDRELANERRRLDECERTCLQKNLRLYQQLGPGIGGAPAAAAGPDHARSPSEQCVSSQEEQLAVREDLPAQNMSGADSEGYNGVPVSARPTSELPEFVQLERNVQQRYLEIAADAQRDQMQQTARMREREAAEARARELHRTRPSNVERLVVRDARSRAAAEGYVPRLDPTVGRLDVFMGVDESGRFQPQSHVRTESRMSDVSESYAYGVEEPDDVDMADFIEAEDEPGAREQIDAAYDHVMSVDRDEDARGVPQQLQFRDSQLNMEDEVRFSALTQDYTPSPVRVRPAGLDDEAGEDNDSEMNMSE
jgi:hypothetical protein